MHSPTKVLLGSTTSSARESSDYDSDPASFPAGKFVSLTSTGVLSLLKSAGMRIGVSLGKSLSNHKKTSVVRSGEGVPVLLSLKRARATITITSYANLVSGTDDAITIDGTAFTAQAGAATPGDATFQAATGNNETAASLAAQINAHATAGAKVRASASGAVVTIAAITPGAAGNALTLTYTDNDTNVGATVSGSMLASGSDTISDIAYDVIGGTVYVDDISGLATENLPGATASNAVYVSQQLTGVNEDSSEAPAALIDMPGGV